MWRVFCVVAYRRIEIWRIYRSMYAGCVRVCVCTTLELLYSIIIYIYIYINEYILIFIIPVSTTTSLCVGVVVLSRALWRHILVPYKCRIILRLSYVRPCNWEERFIHVSCFCNWCTDACIHRCNRTIQHTSVDHTTNKKTHHLWISLRKERRDSALLGVVTKN